MLRVVLQNLWLCLEAVVQSVVPSCFFLTDTSQKFCKPVGTQPSRSVANVSRQANMYKAEHE